MDIAVATGSSGAAVFNEQGRMVGMYIRSHNASCGAEGVIKYATKSKDIADELDLIYNFYLSQPVGMRGYQKLHTLVLFLSSRGKHSKNNVPETKAGEGGSTDGGRKHEDHQSGNETLDDASVLTAPENNGYWEQSHNWARQLEASGVPWKSAAHHVIERQRDYQWAKWFFFSSMKGQKHDASFFNACALLVRDVASDNCLPVLEANELASTVDDIAEAGWLMDALPTLMFAPQPVQSYLSSGSVKSINSFQFTLENLRPALQKFPILWRRLIQLLVQGPLGWHSMTSLTAEEDYLQRDIKFLMNVQEYSGISAMSWEVAIQKQIEQELYPSSTEGPLGWQSMTSLKAEEAYLQRDIEFLMNVQEYSEISAMSWEAPNHKLIEQEFYVSSIEAGLFFLKHAETVEKELPTRELHELVSLSLQCVCPLHLLRDIETRVTADVVTKMDSHLNSMKSRASEKGDIKENNNLRHKSLQTWDDGISAATGSTKIKRRSRPHGSSRQFISDIIDRSADADEISLSPLNHIYDLEDESLRIYSSFSRWEERIGPAERERAVLSLLEFGQITAAKKLQHKLSSGRVPFQLKIVDAALKFEELSTPLQKQPLSMLDEDLCSLIQSYNLPTEDHLFDPLQVVPLAVTHFQDYVLLSSCALLLEICGLSASVLRVNVAVLRQSRRHSLYRSNQFMQQNQLLSNSAILHAVSSEITVANFVVQALADHYPHKSGNISKQEDAQKPAANHQSPTLLLVLQHLEKAQVGGYPSDSVIQVAARGFTDPRLRTHIVTVLRGMQRCKLGILPDSPKGRNEASHPYQTINTSAQGEKQKESGKSLLVKAKELSWFCWMWLLHVFLKLFHYIFA